MIDASELTPLQRRVLLVGCAEPKLLGELLLDAHSNSDNAGIFRPYMNTLVQRGLFEETSGTRRRRLYSITPAGEQVADLVFASQQGQA